MTNTTLLLLLPLPLLPRAVGGYLTFTQLNELFQVGWWVGG